MGDVGDALIRGGNPNDPNFGKPPANGKGRPRNVRIDHISFGIQPFDPDAVKDGLEKRGLRAQIDTGNTGDIHQAAYKSFHTRTPNGYNLQMSCVTKDTRLIGSDRIGPGGPAQTRASMPVRSRPRTHAQNVGRFPLSDRTSYRPRSPRICATRKSTTRSNGSNPNACPIGKRRFEFALIS
jgi:hypothetical protein